MAVLSSNSIAQDLAPRAADVLKVFETDDSTIGGLSVAARSDGRGGGVAWVVRTPTQERVQFAAVVDGALSQPVAFVDVHPKFPKGQVALAFQSGFGYWIAYAETAPKGSSLIRMACLEMNRTHWQATGSIALDDGSTIGDLRIATIQDSGPVLFWTSSRDGESQVSAQALTSDMGVAAFTTNTLTAVPEPIALTTIVSPTHAGIVAWRGERPVQACFLGNAGGAPLRVVEVKPAANNASGLPALSQLLPTQPMHLELPGGLKSEQMRAIRIGTISDEWGISAFDDGDGIANILLFRSHEVALASRRVGTSRGQMRPGTGSVLYRAGEHEQILAVAASANIGLPQCVVVLIDNSMTNTQSLVYVPTSPRP